MQRPEIHSHGSPPKYLAINKNTLHTFQAISQNMLGLEGYRKYALEVQGKNSTLSRRVLIILNCINF